jgi:thiamine biosynthesis lipoprotein
MRKLISACFVLCCFLVAFFALKSFQRRHVFEEMLIMGTVGRISIITDQDIGRDRAQVIINEAFQRLKDYEQKWNYYSAESQISLINNNASQKPIKLSKDTFDLINKAIEFSNLTNRIFDITAPALHSTALRGNIVLNAADQDISFKDPQTKIDLGGIATGFAIDRIVEYFDSRNVKNYLIDIGGDIYAKGNNQYGRSWQIGIRNPDRQNEILEQLSINGQAVTTSGNYVKNHIIDPATKKPVKTDIKSVTVVAETCTQSDALATAFFIMGIEKTKEFIDSYDHALTVWFIKNTGKKSAVIKLDRSNSEKR